MYCLSASWHWGQLLDCLMVCQQLHEQTSCRKSVDLFSNSRKKSFSRRRTSSTVACSYALQGCCGLFGKVSELESLHLKRNTGTAEDDTLMGTDVCSNVICRLMESGYRCGRDSSTLTCVHDKANCGHQIPLIRPDRDQEPILTYCQLHQSFGLHCPAGRWTVFDISSVDNQGFTVSQ